MSEVLTEDRYDFEKAEQERVNGEFAKIVEDFRDESEAGLHELIATHMPEWLEAPEKTIPAFVEALNKTNIDRRVGALDEIGAGRFLDTQSFITRTEDEEGIDECYTIKTVTDPRNKDHFYARTSYVVDMLSEDTAETISIDPDGRMTFSRTRARGETGQSVEAVTDDHEKTDMMESFFARAARAQWIQAQRDPDAAKKADTNALKQAQEHTHLNLYPETSPD